MTKRPHEHAPLFAAVSLVLALTACNNAEAENNEAEDGGTEESSSSVIITDEFDREVEIDAPVQAAYADLWYNAEILRAIGAGDAIVSIDDTADPSGNPNNAEYFADFEGLPAVGDHNDPNWEAIVESGAEVAVVRRNGPYEEAISNLEPFGIDVILFTGWDPEVIREFVPALGEAFGTEEQAAELIELYDDIDAIIAERTAEAEPKTVYYENNGNYVTGVPGSGWHDIIEAAGGVNIYGDVSGLDDQGANVHEYEVDPVDIIDRNPDVIVRQGIEGITGGYETWAEEDAQTQAQEIAERPGWSNVSAVENGDVVVVDNFLLSALGKQVGALAIATWLYPEEFEDVDISDYFDRWLELQGVEPRSADEYIFRLGAGS